MNDKFTKILLFGTVFVITIFLLLFTIIQLTDPIDLGYFPAISYRLLYLRAFLLFFQFVLFCVYRKQKEIVMIIVIGGIINLILFGLNEVIALSVAFN